VRKRLRIPEEPDSRPGPWLAPPGKAGLSQSRQHINASIGNPEVGRHWHKG